MLKRQALGPWATNYRARAPLERIAALFTAGAVCAPAIKLYHLAEAADALGISSATADNDWAYAKSWLKRELTRDATKS